MDPKIIAELSKYYGRSSISLKEELEISIDRNSKSYYRYVTDRLLTYISQSSFGKQSEIILNGVVVRVCRVAQGATTPKESVSFSPIDYNQLVQEEWEICELRRTFLREFLFIFFREDRTINDYFLERAITWSMPKEDLDGTVRAAWERTFLSVCSGRYDDFPKISDDVIIHVRPHATLSSNRVETPQGMYMKKMSFWINSKYVGLIYQGLK